uniref:Uncharacterized protein n=1 Tax=Romanomermis culicivorax TaxID=13658 RepID=A0A915KHA2_ROMCU
MPKRTEHVSVVLWYQPMEDTLAPLASFATQGLLPRIPTDLALEVIHQLESMNLIDSSSITDTMRAVWSMSLTKKYPQLSWALLNEPFEVEALTAADIVLSAPAALRI